MEEQRTTAQNKALHKLFGDISAYCVETGIDQRTVVNKLEAYSCPTSPQFVKETWRAMQVAITGKTRTTEDGTVEAEGLCITPNSNVRDVWFRREDIG
jgi:hypothetical protein